MSRLWQVQVFAGATDIDVTSAPVMFGTPAATVGEQGMSPVREPLVYGPVELHTSEQSLSVRTTEWRPAADGSSGLEGHPIIHREMDQVFSWEFDWTGALRVRGLEFRSDGVGVYALWEIEPFDAPLPTCDGCNHPATWHVLGGVSACSSTWPERCDCPHFTGPDTPTTTTG